MNTQTGFRGDPRDGSRLPEDEAYWARLQGTVVEQGQEVLGAYADADRREGSTGAHDQRWTAPVWAVSTLAVAAAAAVLLVIALPPGTRVMPNGSAVVDGAMGAELNWSRSLAPGDPLGVRLLGPEPPSVLELALGSPDEAGR